MLATSGEEARDVLGGIEFTAKAGALDVGCVLARPRPAVAAGAGYNVAAVVGDVGLCQLCGHRVPDGRERGGEVERMVA